MAPEAALAACRFLHDLSLMLLWGASAYLVTLVPRALAEDVGRRLRSFGVVAGALAVATTAVALPLEAAAIGDGWSDALAPATLRDVLFETSVGSAWQIQAIAALLLAATLAVPARGRGRATAPAAGLLLASLALTGHAVMQAGWLGVAHRINDAIHVLAAGAWLGALVALLVILGTPDDRGLRGEAETALRRFSTAGHIAVALVLASGVINTVLVLGRWPTDWSSPYQAMLACKIALVVLMIGLATVNRYAYVPQLARRRASALRAIARGTLAEVALGVLVIGLVAIFGMVEPR